MSSRSAKRQYAQTPIARHGYYLTLFVSCAQSWIRSTSPVVALGVQLRIKRYCQIRYTSVERDT
ncbi:MAG: hypothetical protein WB586_00175 [Chthoniobacterales bacterium]